MDEWREENSTGGVLPEIPLHIAVNEVISQGDRLDLQAFVLPDLLVEIGDPEPDLLQVCLRSSSRLPPFGCHQRWKELQIFSFTCSLLIDLLWQPSDPVVYTDLQDLALVFEAIQELLTDHPDLPPNPRMVRDDLPSNRSTLQKKPIYDEQKDYTQNKFLSSVMDPF